MLPMKRRGARWRSCSRGKRAGWILPMAGTPEPRPAGFVHAVVARSLINIKAERFLPSRRPANATSWHHLARQLGGPLTRMALGANPMRNVIALCAAAGLADG